MTQQIIRIGCRASPLAQIQADLVIDLLQLQRSGYTYEKILIHSAGDRDLSQPIASLGVGVFVREIQQSLRSGEIDIAIHSAKDLPSANPVDFWTGSVGPRADWRDCLLLRAGTQLSDFAQPRIGTSAPRRTAKVIQTWPQAKSTPLRGNLGTRLARLDAGELDAIILAAAGLHRLGWTERIGQYLDWLPAGGQGVLAAQCRATDTELIATLRAVQLPAVELAWQAEREFLAALQAGCTTPLGVLGEYRRSEVHLIAELSEPTGEVKKRAQQTGIDPVAVARTLAREFGA